jgi:hypothetical protein
VSGEYEPAEVPLCEGPEAREEMYRRAEREAEPFFAVERYEGGYAVTYDLLPAGHELSKPACKELNEQLTRRVESLVSDPSVSTVEVSKTVSESLGSVSLFERERTARDVAALVSRTVLDERNWVEASPPDPTTSADVRRN